MGWPDHSEQLELAAVGGICSSIAVFKSIHLD